MAYFKSYIMNYDIVVGTYIRIVQLSSYYPESKNGNITGIFPVAKRNIFESQVFHIVLH